MSKGEAGSALILYCAAVVGMEKVDMVGDECFLAVVVGGGGVVAGGGLSDNDKKIWLASKEEHSNLTSFNTNETWSSITGSSSGLYT